MWAFLRIMDGARIPEKYEHVIPQVVIDDDDKTGKLKIKSAVHQGDALKISSKTYHGKKGK